MPEEEVLAVCQRAERLLASSYGLPLRLEVCERLDSAHLVLRCAARAESPEVQVPATVIVKQRASEGPQPSQGFDQGLLFANEWASLEFLAARAPAAGLGPRLYASDRQRGLMVLEDLGATPTVQGLLYGTDRIKAREALVAIGECLGRLQAATYGHEHAFRARQTALGAVTTVCDASLDCRACLPDLLLDYFPAFGGAPYTYPME